METPLSAEEQLNKLETFRQRLYDDGFTARKDALFDLLDALLLSGPVRSFAELSLNPAFRRQWPSLYAAIEDGQLDIEALRKLLAEMLPQEGVLVFPIDASLWPRPASPTLPDRQYGHTGKSKASAAPVQIGYVYSILGWASEPKTSWTLPLDVERVPSDQSETAVGVEQVKRLCERLPAGVVILIVGDCVYGRPAFLIALAGERCGILFKLAKNRVLYQEPGPRFGPGRPRKHGEPFAFKDPSTWGEPDETVTLETERFGTVVIRSWANLHQKGAAEVPFTLLGVQAHAERTTPPKPFWLGYVAPTPAPEADTSAIPSDAAARWRQYPWRW